MPCGLRFWKRKGKKRVRNVDSDPSGVPMITSPINEPSPRQQTNLMIERKEDEVHQRWDASINSALTATPVVLALVAKAAVLAPLESIKTAASLALKIMETCQAVEENDHLYRLMAVDATQLVAIIWWSYQQSPTQKAWLTPNLQQVVQELVRSLTDIDGFVKELKNQGVFIRILPSPVEVSEIKAYRDCIDKAVTRFEMFAHCKLADMLMQVSNEKNETNQDLMDDSVAVGALDDGILGIHDAMSTMIDEPEPSLSPSGHAPVQMFTSASNFAILGGNFIGSQTIVHGPDDEARLKVVYDTAAPNAILNAGGRADEVRCHPGTREEVLSKCEIWMEPPAGQEFSSCHKRIFWLSGPAGAGKSAIMQTLAERRQARGLAMANFFFFRNDSTRSDAAPLVATILVQLFKKYPTLKPLIAAVLADNPLIFKQSLRDQFQHLIDVPIRSLRTANPFLFQQAIVLLVDGLDECSSDANHEQQSLLKVLHDIASRDGSPFLVFVASRPEPHLIMTFNQVGFSAASIFLSEDYHPEDDIRLFVTERLAEIKTSHHLGLKLAQSWPTDDQIGKVVNKSSGQFIYAATVIRFISGSSASPAFSLDIVHSLRPVSRTSPFAELDALYTHILSQVGDWKSAKDVLTVHLLRERTGYLFALYDGLRPVGYEYGDIPSFVSDLPALVKLEASGNLELYHASLSDFLRDKSRSGDYHIDIQEFCDTRAPNFVRCIWDNDSLKACRVILEHATGPSLSITEALLSFPTLGFQFAHYGWVYPVRFMGKTLRDYCREDDQLYKQLVQLWIAWFRKNGIIFEELDVGDLYFDELQAIKAQLEPQVWEEIICSSKAEKESRQWWTF